MRVGRRGVTSGSNQDTQCSPRRNAKVMGRDVNHMCTPKQDHLGFLRVESASGGLVAPVENELTLKTSIPCCPGPHSIPVAQLCLQTMEAACFASADWTQIQLPELVEVPFWGGCCLLCGPSHSLADLCRLPPVLPAHSGLHLPKPKPVLPSRPKLSKLFEVYVMSSISAGCHMGTTSPVIIFSKIASKEEAWEPFLK